MQFPMLAVDLLWLGGGFTLGYCLSSTFARQQVRQLWDALAAQAKWHDEERSRLLQALNRSPDKKHKGVHDS